VHYEPTAESSAPIVSATGCSSDIWARFPAAERLFDIAWGAYAGRDVPEKLQQVFGSCVRPARGPGGDPPTPGTDVEALEGWQVDDIARGIIAAAGYGDRSTSTATAWDPPAPA